MSDFDSSLPIRTESNGDIATKLVDGINPLLEAEVDALKDLHTRAKLADGSGNDFGTIPNPINVAITNNVLGDGIVDKNEAIDLASDASATHAYSISAAKTGRLLAIHVSGSGKLKVEVKYGPTGLTISKYIDFNSTSNPKIEWVIRSEVLLNATDDIEVIVTNRDNQAQSIYSTIELTEF